MTEFPVIKRSFAKIGFDLDDTLAYGVWPEPGIGQINPRAKDFVLHYHALGFSIVIFTSRPEDHRERIWRWLEDNGLGNVVYSVITDKPHFDALFDDRAIQWCDG